MKALFLGNVAADTANGIRAELPPGLRVEVFADPKQLLQSPAAARDADILVSNHWSADYPAAPKLRLVQSVATGTELIDLAARRERRLRHSSRPQCGAEEAANSRELTGDRRRRQLVRPRTAELCRVLRERPHVDPLALDALHAVLDESLVVRPGHDLDGEEGRRVELLIGPAHDDEVGSGQCVEER